MEIEGDRARSHICHSKLRQLLYRMCPNMLRMLYPAMSQLCGA